MSGVSVGPEGDTAVAGSAGRRGQVLAATGAWLHGFRFSNWSFWVKLGICPALAVLTLVAVSSQGIWAAGQQEALVDRVASIDLGLAVRLNQQAAAVQELNGRLYRLATLRASQAQGLDVAREAARLTEDADKLAERVDGTAGLPGAEAYATELHAIAADLRIYRDAIDVFGSMLELDFQSAVQFIRPFDRNATKMLTGIKAMSERVSEGAQASAVRSQDLADRIRFSLSMASIIMSAVAMMVAALLTRATVRSVRQIADATQRVARGGPAVDVAALARGDELGTIVDSLAVFQANVSKIAFLAHHDPLTRLPNRVLFNDRIDQALARRDKSASFAVLCLDLDRFKAVNDTLGHPVGDALLRQVANRLQLCVREGDTVARLGGDEFAIIALGVSSAAEVDDLASRIIEVVGSAYDVDGHRISIGTSIGIALAPNDGRIGVELLKNADTALYGAKAGGRGTACFYEAAMNASLQERRELETGLRIAIEQEEFLLYFQPLVDAKTRRVCSFEALIRWQRPGHGIVSPNLFIPVAESSGLIGTIGRWVLRRACREAATWPDDLSVAVNLSPSQLKDKSLVSDIVAALSDSGLEARRLEVEITESVLMTDSEATLETLRRIKALGVKISMDDFGTGYSSLSYLRSFPFDKVKIDRSFIKDLPHDQNSRAIVRAIVGLSDSFGMAITAEGVETDDQAAELALQECTHLQGFYFSRPTAADMVGDVIETLRARERPPCVA